MYQVLGQCRGIIILTVFLSHSVQFCIQSSSFQLFLLLDLIRVFWSISNGVEFLSLFTDVIVEFSSWN